MPADSTTWRRQAVHRLALALGVAATCCLSAGCAKQKPETAAPIRHVLLITLDTCRADHLGCYGYAGPVSPNLDALARDGTRFDQAQSPCPLTLPAHCSLLTGTLPTTHGIHDNLGGRLGDQNDSLAELLQQAGFQTAAIVSSFVLDYRFGLHQGFALYDDRFDRPAQAASIAERSGAEATRHAIDWLQQNATNRCFLFLHYYDAHYPYTPPEPFATQFAASPYAGEVAYVDHNVGDVVRELKRLGLYDSTLIVVAGDHGESLGEHGETKHGYFIYQSTLRVPLIMRIPGRKQVATIAERVGLIDIVPTILGALGLPVPTAVQGRDLGPLLAGQPTLASYNADYLAESLTPTKYGANPLFGLVRENRKFILTTRPELYDLGTDPLETFSLAATQADAVAPLQEALSRFLASAAQQTAAGPAPADAEALAKLRSLGYAGGAVVTDFTLDPAKADPKDVAALAEQVSIAIGLIEQQDFAGASQLCARILSQREDLAEVHTLMGQAASGIGDLDTARAHFTRALALAPGDAQTRDLLAGVLADMGRDDEAVAEYRHALERFPDSVDIRNNLVGVLTRTGKLDEAIALCEEALRLDPRLTDVHANLAYALELQGRSADADRHYAIALQGESTHAEVYNNLANYLFTRQRLDEAIVAYEKALQLNPRLADAHYNLGGALLKKGNPGNALTHFATAAQLAPEDPDIQVQLAATLADQGRTADALAACETALKLNPGHAEARALHAKLTARTSSPP
ncbi:MAG: sulfatase-like hydrolase/transferase [Lentisphaerae bacterium]|nr:sulfatase-like hydrolase/transferase [Lentisphaerota bacterium]